MRLVPKNNGMGWATYALLGYLGFFLIDPILDHAGAVTWVWTGLGLLLFLVLYFTLFWLCGWKSVVCAFAVALLGVAYLPSNGGASCFFIYAASFLAFEEKAATSFKYIGGIAALLAVELYILHRPPVAWFVDIGLVIMIGLLNVYFSQHGRAQKKLIRAQEEIEHLAKIAERERIARDLHDVLGHTLSVIVLKSELASKLLEVDPGRAKAEMVDVEQTARHALAEVRQAIGGYRSNGLTAELAQARATLETAGIKVECEQTPVTLPATQESVLSLAVREAVTNVVRHADAARCRLELRAADGVCRLSIQDDGRGGSQQEGNGLTGMRERVEALGGTLRRETKGGTRLHITVPLGTEAGHA
ncbi:sensor histidine kinase [Acidisarcina polymorpha]|uniref:Sensor histidine kinase n=1 Tax=Acidisarcina polymorpha TaxID=2211140 RepID=A0A2Z5FYF2_9BACT|nr:sensor histidine kinase [Acidisarcina polymorpha]AXC11435.1 sensor histidine kinase [Acidisarcina polymorpha]